MPHKELYLFKTSDGRFLAELDKEEVFNPPMIGAVSLGKYECYRSLYMLDGQWHEYDEVLTTLKEDFEEERLVMTDDADAKFDIDQVKVVVFKEQD